MPIEPTKSRKDRVLIVDDHRVLREALTHFINEQSDLTCCGEADTVEATLAAIERDRPDVVLLDLRLRNQDGLDLIKTLTAKYPELRITVLTQCDEKVYAERSFRAGARGYVVKSQGTEEVLSAIRAVLRGHLYVSKEVAFSVLRAYQSARRSRSVGIARLSDRELEVFRLLGEGLSAKEIGAEIRRSSKTVDTHRESIKRKLGLINAREVTGCAIVWVQKGANPKELLA